MPTVSSSSSRSDVSRVTWSPWARTAAAASVMLAVAGGPVAFAASEPQASSAPPRAAISVTSTAQTKAPASRVTLLLKDDMAKSFGANARLGSTYKEIEGIVHELPKSVTPGSQTFVERMLLRADTKSVEVEVGASDHANYTVCVGPASATACVVDVPIQAVDEHVYRVESKDGLWSLRGGNRGSGVEPVSSEFALTFIFPRGKRVDVGAKGELELLTVTAKGAEPVIKVNGAVVATRAREVATHGLAARVRGFRVPVPIGLTKLNVSYVDGDVADVDDFVVYRRE